MRGTLAQGETLWIEPVPFGTLKRGDVVAFAAGGKVLAHRIVGRDPQGFRTRGDANEGPDAAPLAAAGVIGRVVAKEGRCGRTKVAGGWRGNLRGLVLRAGFRVFRRLGRLWGGAAHFLCVTGLGPLIWRPRIWVAHYESLDGPCVKYIHHGRTVAAWMPAHRQWQCRPPYDLVLSPPV